MLVRNTNGSGNHFTITGGGQTHGRVIRRYGALDRGTLRVQSKLLVDDTITVGGPRSTAASVTATGNVTGSQPAHATTCPASVLATRSSLYQHETRAGSTSGRNNAWEELATIDSTVSRGHVHDQCGAAIGDGSAGLGPLNGRTVTETDYPRCSRSIRCCAMSRRTPRRPYRVMKLPDATGVCR